jgi:enamine deaminase RidA (YjgF/YER057c/UK114 family)
VIAPPGRLVSISGQVAIDSTGAVIGEGDFVAQCAQVFENLRQALRSVGLTFVDVVRTDMFVTDLRHLSALRECRARYLPSDDPPTSTLLKVDALLHPELMLEVAIDAVLPQRSSESGPVPPS